MNRITLGSRTFRGRSAAVGISPARVPARVRIFARRYSAIHNNHTPEVATAWIVARNADGNQDENKGDEPPDDERIDLIVLMICIFLAWMMTRRYDENRRFHLGRLRHSYEDIQE